MPSLDMGSIARFPLFRPRPAGDRPANPPAGARDPRRPKPRILAGHGVHEVQGQLLTGLVNGLTGSQVMPLVPYLLSLELNASTFVQASNISFTLSSLLMLAGLARIGLLGWAELGLTIAGIAPALLGVAIGNAIRQRLAPETLRKLVLGALLAMGLALVVKAVG